MSEIRIKLSGIWVALMLTYLLGDVMRIFSGDFSAGEIGGMEMSQGIYLGMAVLMVIPILMVFLSLVLPEKAIRWTNIVVAIFLVVLNLFGLPYKGWYDNFLIVMSFVFNALTVWYAWNWV